MTVTNVLQASVRGLPQALRTAQAAIDLPDVQEMLWKLSKYQLGIFMPHMHDEHTGDFHSLPGNLTQVESGLEVSFQPSEQIANQADRFIPVAWCWRGGESTAVAACEMIQEDGLDGKERYVKHKMKES